MLFQASGNTARPFFWHLRLKNKSKHRANYQECNNRWLPFTCWIVAPSRIMTLYLYLSFQIKIFIHPACRPPGSMFLTYIFYNLLWLLYLCCWSVVCLDVSPSLARDQGAHFWAIWIKLTWFDSKNSTRNTSFWIILNVFVSSKMHCRKLHTAIILPGKKAWLEPGVSGRLGGVERK